LLELGIWGVVELLNCGVSLLRRCGVAELGGTMTASIEKVVSTMYLQSLCEWKE
jgi:hypothetical protein